MRFFFIGKIMSSNFSNDSEGRLTLNLGLLEVKEVFSHELFAKRNLKPIIMFSTTSGGKTVTCVDVMRVCLEAGYN